MANKEAIELGMRLHRLMDNEDFQDTILKEWASRIANRNTQLKVQASSLNSNPVIIDRLTNRIDELEDFLSWIDDSIETGGHEKLKEQAQPAEVPA